MSKNGNILLPLITVIAILAIAVAGFFFWQNKQSSNSTQDNIVEAPPTVTPEGSETKSYKNSKFGFSFDYPASFELTESNNNINLKNPATKLSEKEHPDSGRITISVQPGTLANLMAQPNPINGSATREIYRVYKTQRIAGKTAEVTFGGCCGGFGEYVFIENNGNLYILTLYGLTKPTDLRYNQADFDQILSTFKFTTPEFSCPPEEKYIKGYLNCMPGPDNDDLKYCNAEYQAWMETNCKEIDIAN